MSDIVTSLLSYGVLASHFLLVFFILAVVFKDTWGRGVVDLVGKNALIFSLGIILAAVLGSLFYSEVRGFEPCILCWWQRVFIYPLAIMFPLAIWKRRKDIFLYAAPLVTLAALVAGYQYYAVVLGGSSVLSCTDVGGACSRVYVRQFGYITIELMSLTASLYILIFAWANKIYEAR